MISNATIYSIEDSLKNIIYIGSTININRREI